MKLTKDIFNQKKDLVNKVGTLNDDSLCVKIVSPTIYEVFDGLSSYEEFHFISSANKDETSTKRIVIGDILSSLSIIDVNLTLDEIEKSNIPQYVTICSVEWSSSLINGKVSKSPFILIPIKLKKTDDDFSFKADCNVREIQVSPKIVGILKSDFGLYLPNLSDFDNLAQFLNSVRKLFDVHKIRVIEECEVRNFDIAGYELYDAFSNFETEIISNEKITVNDNQKYLHQIDLLISEPFEQKMSKALSYMTNEFYTDELDALNFFDSGVSFSIDTCNNSNIYNLTSNFVANSILKKNKTLILCDNNVTYNNICKAITKTDISKLATFVDYDFLENINSGANSLFCDEAYDIINNDTDKLISDIIMTLSSFEEVETEFKNVISPLNMSIDEVVSKMVDLPRHEYFSFNFEDASDISSLKLHENTYFLNNYSKLQSEVFVEFEKSNWKNLTKQQVKPSVVIEEVKEDASRLLDKYEYFNKLCDLFGFDSILPDTKSFYYLMECVDFLCKYDLYVHKKFLKHYDVASISDEILNYQIATKTFESFSQFPFLELAKIDQVNSISAMYEDLGLTIYKAKNHTLLKELSCDEITQSKVNLIENIENVGATLSEALTYVYEIIDIIPILYFLNVNDIVNLFETCDDFNKINKELSISVELSRDEILEDIDLAKFCKQKIAKIDTKVLELDKVFTSELFSYEYEWVNESSKLYMESTVLSLLNINRLKQVNKFKSILRDTSIDDSTLTEAVEKFRVVCDDIEELGEALSKLNTNYENITEKTNFDAFLKLLNKYLELGDYFGFDNIVSALSLKDTTAYTKLKEVIGKDFFDNVCSTFKIDKKAVGSLSLREIDIYDYEVIEHLQIINILFSKIQEAFNSTDIKYSDIDKNIAIIKQYNKTKESLEVSPILKEFFDYAIEFDIVTYCKGSNTLLERLDYLGLDENNQLNILDTDNFNTLKTEYYNVFLEFKSFNFMLDNVLSLFDIKELKDLNYYEKQLFLENLLETSKSIKDFDLVYDYYNDLKKLSLDKFISEFEESGTDRKEVLHCYLYNFYKSWLSKRYDVCRDVIEEFENRNRSFSSSLKVLKKNNASRIYATYCNSLPALDTKKDGYDELDVYREIKQYTYSFKELLKKVPNLYQKFNPIMVAKSKDIVTLINNKNISFDTVIAFYEDDMTSLQVFYPLRSAKQLVVVKDKGVKLENPILDGLFTVDEMTVLSDNHKLIHENIEKSEKKTFNFEKYVLNLSSGIFEELDILVFEEDENALNKPNNNSYQKTATAAYDSIIVYEEEKICTSKLSSFKFLYSTNIYFDSVSFVSSQFFNSEYFSFVCSWISPEFKLLETFNGLELSRMEVVKKQKQYEVNYYDFLQYVETNLYDIEPSEDENIFVSNAVAYIVMTESPVHINIVTSKIESLLGKKYTESNVKDNVEYIIRAYLNDFVLLNGSFLWKSSITYDIARNCSYTRDIEYIANEELVDGLLKIINKSIGIEREEIIKCASKQFNLDLNLSSVTYKLQTCLDYLIETQQVKVFDNKVIIY